MYKAIHVQTGEEIIILNPFWLKRIEGLREMDRADELVCQGCRQALRVKAGEVKRPHFAHKHLKACSYGSESPEILNARAVLYGWLFRQFGPEVHVEKLVESSRLPRPVDCWIEAARECGVTSGPFAYWIIEAGIKLEPREAIRAEFERLGVKVHYIFLHSMLYEKKQELFSLLLTPTERAFMQATAYDEVLAGASEPGKSLHYLDAEAGTLTTYRGLALFHAPNWYKGVKKTGTLDTVSASRVDGEPVQRGEAEQLRSFRQKQQRLAQKRQSYQEREAAWEGHLASGRRDGWGTGRQGDPFPAALPCVTCGQITTDYWSAFTDETGRRLCRCRECLEREG